MGGRKEGREGGMKGGREEVIKYSECGSEMMMMMIIIIIIIMGTAHILRKVLT